MKTGSSPGMEARQSANIYRALLCASLFWALGIQWGLRRTCSLSSWSLQFSREERGQETIAGEASALKGSSPLAGWFWGSDPPPGGHQLRPGRGAAASKAGGSGGHDGGQLSLTCPEAQKEGKAHGPGPRRVPGTEDVLYADMSLYPVGRGACTPDSQRWCCSPERRRDLHMVTQNVIARGRVRPLLAGRPRAVVCSFLLLHC